MTSCALLSSWAHSAVTPFSEEGEFVEEGQRRLIRDKMSNSDMILDKNRRRLIAQTVLFDLITLR